MFILLSGRMEIVQPTNDGERPVATHDPGEFTGEIIMISGRRSLVRGRVTEAGEFLEISPENLRSLIAKDAELSEIFMRAFILRRLALITQGLGDVIVMGSMHCAATLRLREFLGRNGHPYTFVDLDTDKQSQELLDRFNVKIGDVPVLICRGKVVLRHPTVQQVADCLGFNNPVDESQVRDLIVVGAGPSGLAAAVYAASEGLDVLVIETNAPGGQAGSSSKIENYLGFPDWHIGHGTGGARAQPGTKVWRAIDDRPWSGSTRLRTQTIPNRTRQRTKAHRQNGRDRLRRTVQPAVDSEPREIRGSRSVLRRNQHGSAIVRGRRGHRRGRWKLRRTGSGVPVRVRDAGSTWWCGPGDYPTPCRAT